MQKLFVEVKRTSGAWERYTVEAEEGMTVLQVVENIYMYQDPSLAYRYSCRIGLCATCNMMINGKPGLSCNTIAVPGDQGVLTLAPLPRGKTVKDLAKEM